MKPEDKAVVQQALEALELNNQEWKELADSGDCGFWKAEDQVHYKQTSKAIADLRQLLEQPEPVQEPFGTYMGHRMTPAGTKEFWGWADAPIPVGTKLYTTPPAQPAPVQEPKFAPYWAVTDMEGKHIKVNIETQRLEIYEEQRWAQANVQSNTKATLVYITRTTPPAAQPQREWVDDAGRLQWALWRIKELEAKLREKNGGAA